MKTMAAQCATEPLIIAESSSAVNNIVKQVSVAPNVQAKGKKRAISPAAQPLTLPNSSNSKRRKVHSVSGVSQTQVKLTIFNCLQYLRGQIFFYFLLSCMYVYYMIKSLWTPDHYSPSCQVDNTNLNRAPLYTITLKCLFFTLKLRGPQHVPVYK